MINYEYDIYNRQMNKAGGITSKALSYVFVVLILYFIIKATSFNLQAVKDFDFRINIFYVIVSSLFYFIGFVFLSLPHIYILNKMGYKVLFRDNLKYLIYGQFGGYVPGKVWLYAIRYNFLKKYNVKINHYLSVFFIESFLLIISAFFISYILLGRAYIDFVPPYVIYLISLLVFVVIIPKVFYRILNIGMRIIKKDKIEIDMQMGFGDFFAVFVFFCVYWIFLGASFYFLSLNFYYNLNILYIIGVFVLSYVVGLVSVFAPKGLGVREGMVSVLLSRVMPSYQATALSFIARLWSTANELFYSFLFWCGDMLKRRKYEDK